MDISAPMAKPYERFEGQSRSRERDINITTSILDALMNPVVGVRIDKWLWAVRVYKTRSLATIACRDDKVLIGQQSAKPSRIVRIGDEIRVRLDLLTRTVRVIGIIEKRVGPN